MRIKHRKFLSALLIFTLVIPLITGETSITIQTQAATAASSNSTEHFSFKTSENTNVEWEASGDTSTSAFTPSIGIHGLSSLDFAFLRFPTFEEFRVQAYNAGYNWKNADYSNSLKLSTDSFTRSQFNNVNSFVKVEIPDNYPEITSGLFTDNAYIEELVISAPNTDLTLDQNCFANMQSLQKVTIDSKSVTFCGSVFSGCTKLYNISVSTNNNGQITFQGTGSNFNNCDNLQSAVFKGSVFFESTNAEFSGNTFSSIDESKNMTSTVTFEGPVTNTGKVFDFQGSDTKTFHITNLNFRGSGSVLNENFLYQTSVKNLNIEAKTQLTQKAFNGGKTTTIDGLSLNAPVDFAIKALFQEHITNLYFNINPTGENFPVSAPANYSGPIGPGWETKVTNLYFNYKNFSKTAIACSSLENISLGNTKETSLNCDNIFFLNPYFSNIVNATYKRCDGSKTEIYGYGGSYTPSNQSCYELFTEWANAANGNFHNYVVGATNSSYKIHNPTIYLSGTDSYWYDFSSTDNLEVVSSYLDASTASELTGQTITDGMEYTVPMTTSGLSDVNTNFCYRIWKTVDSSTASDAVTITYQNVRYTPLTSTTCKLTEGTHSFLLELGGRKFPFSIYVTSNLVESISKITTADGNDTLTLSYNQTVTPDMLKVYVTYTDGKEGILPNNGYTIENPVIQKKENDIIISVKLPNGTDVIHKTFPVTGNLLEKLSVEPVSGSSLNLTYGEAVDKDMLLVSGTYTDGTKRTLSASEYTLPKLVIDQAQTLVEVSTDLDTPTRLSASLIVYGFPDRVKSFQAHCSNETMSEGSVLHTSDVYLTDIAYENPSITPPEKATEGFHFWINGTSCDTYTIKEGENKISITYGNSVLEDALIIQGTKSTITKVEAVYLGTGVYEGHRIPVNPETIAVYIYKENAEEAVLATDYSLVTLSDYEITASTVHEIDVFYNGIKAQKPISVTGLKDGISEISTVSYSGPCIQGTKLANSDFYISIKLFSGTILDSVSNPELLNAVSFSPATLTSDVNRITVFYNQIAYKTITILAASSNQNDPGSLDTAAPVTPSPGTTPNTPFVTGTPAPATNVPEPSETANANITATQTPLATNPVPSSGADITQNSISNSVSTLKKGDTFVQNYVKYKILTWNNQTGTVSVTGYTKGGTPVLKTNVKAGGISFQVVSIEASAFKNCNALKGMISIPSGIRSIGHHAFYNCKNLNQVMINAKLTSIGSKAFYNCKNLKLVDLYSAKKLKKVGTACFKKNASSRKFRIKSASKKRFVKLLKGKY